MERLKQRRRTEDKWERRFAQGLHSGTCVERAQSRSYISPEACGWQVVCWVRLGRETETEKESLKWEEGEVGTKLNNVEVEKMFLQVFFFCVLIRLGRRSRESWRTTTRLFDLTDCTEEMRQAVPRTMSFPRRSVCSAAYHWQVQAGPSTLSRNWLCLTTVTMNALSLFLSLSLFSSFQLLWLTCRQSQQFILLVAVIIHEPISLSHEILQKCSFLCWASICFANTDKPVLHTWLAARLFLTCTGLPYIWVCPYYVRMACSTFFNCFYSYVFLWVFKIALDLAA